MTASVGGVVDVVDAAVVEVDSAVVVVRSAVVVGASVVVVDASLVGGDDSVVSVEAAALVLGALVGGVPGGGCTVGLGLSIMQLSRQVVTPSWGPR
ncbi:MAG: hypothetical protein ACR2HP_09375 [Ilumatobacteraceae bacterium]